jgi:hypothetical protein
MGYDDELWWRFENQFSGVHIYPNAKQALSSMSSTSSSSQLAIGAAVGAAVTAFAFLLFKSSSSSSESSSSNQKESLPKNNQIHRKKEVAVVPKIVDKETWLKARQTLLVRLLVWTPSFF